MSELLGLAPYAALGIFLIFVVYPVIIAGSTIRFSAMATLLWTAATLAWLIPVVWAQVSLPSGARTISLQLGFLAMFCLFGLILIMVVAWRLNAVGKTRWLAVLTPLLPFSLILIGYICLLPGDTRQISRAERRQEKAQARAAAKAAKRANKQAKRQGRAQAAPAASDQQFEPHLAPHMSMPPLPGHGDDTQTLVGGHRLPPLRAGQAGPHASHQPATGHTPQPARRPPAMPPLPQGQIQGQRQGAAPSGPQPPRLPQDQVRQQGPAPHQPAPHHQRPQQQGHQQQGHQSPPQFPQARPRQGQGAAPRGSAAGMPPPLPPKRRG